MALAIAAVALADFFERAREVDCVALLLMLAPAALRPYFGRRREKNLQLGAAGGNVRLRHGHPVAFKRTRFLLHGTADFRAGAESCSKHDFGPGGQETGGENLKSQPQIFINQRPPEMEAAFFVI